MVFVVDPRFFSQTEYSQIAKFIPQPFYHLVLHWSIIFVLVYLSAYLTLRSLFKFSHQKAEGWANRWNSIVHAVYIVYIFYQWFVPTYKRWGALFAPDPLESAFNNDPFQHYILGVTMAYLSVDLFRIIFFLMVEQTVQEDGGLSMLMHHLVIIAGIYTGQKYQFGALYQAYMISNEISTPLLNLRFYLTELGFKGGYLFFINEFLFAILFFFSRVLMNTLTFMDIFKHIPLYLQVHHLYGVPVSMIWIMVFLGVLHLFLQYYWMFLIVRMIRRRFLALKQKSKKE